MDDVIFSPIYRGDKYLYHECSECKYQVRMVESIFAIYFGERFKFCPNCGKQIIRFASLPIFLEEFNYGIFDELDKISEEYIDKVDYYCRVILEVDEFVELKKKCRFALEIEKNGGRKVSYAVKRVAEMMQDKVSHWEIKKLKERVEKALGGVQV